MLYKKYNYYTLLGYNLFIDDNSSWISKSTDQWLTKIWSNLLKLSIQQE